MSKTKMKALTFSFDDGASQDVRMIEIFDRYGLKCTFNLNSGLLGKPNTLIRNNREVSHNKLPAEQIRDIYKNHEVAAHTRTHPCLVGKSEEFITDEVERDRERLSELCGYEVVGMAYPCGGVNNDDAVADVLRRRTGIRYSRTIASNASFAPQTNLLRFDPTVYLLDTDKMFELGSRFLQAKAESPMIMYVWGHSFELDAWDLWERFDDFCRMMSGREDIFYATNAGVLLGEWQ